jgi:hypothetical protein
VVRELKGINRHGYKSLKTERLFDFMEDKIGYELLTPNLAPNKRLLIYKSTRNRQLSLNH